MNYILEIKAFYDWLEVNQLPTSAIALWHGLMHMANKTGWKDNFTVAVVVLEIKTGLKKQAIINARTILQNKGLITFKSRGGNQSATYTINSFGSFKETQNDTQSHTQEHTQSHTQEHTINKLNETKQNEIDITTPLPPLQGEQPTQQKNQSASQKDMKAELNKVWNDSKSEFSPVLQKEIQDWIRYKKEIKKEYKTVIGFARFLTQVKKNVQEFGETAVIQIMDSSMANGYQGITWDKLQKTNKEGIHNGRNQGVAENNSGGNFKEGKADPLAGFKRRTVL